MTPHSPQSPPSNGSALDWSEDGAPRSRLFDDVYFSMVDGLAESRAVFLAGCGLPDAWATRDRFVVGELGFGTGLNILALLDLWRRTRPPGARLHIFSTEAHPLSAGEAARALAAWPELAEVAGVLLARWPGRAKGFHRIDFPAWGAVLDLAVMDVAEALNGWDGRVDAWFLDGFAPARNPAMWSEAVMRRVAARSAPGARAATFTVAGAVRRALQASGFSIDKRPGFGRKRERLEAWLPAPEHSTPSPPARTVAIIGGGIAGAALARAFTALGLAVCVIEAEAPGAGASGNPSALVMPRLDAGGGDVAALYAQAFARAGDLYGRCDGAVIARGAVQLETGPKDPSRFERIANADLFEPEAIERLSPGEVSPRLGEAASVGGLGFAGALAVDPAAILRAWLPADRVIRAKAASLARDADGWRLLDAAGGEIARADLVCLAAGMGCLGFSAPAPLGPVRGQVSLLATKAEPPSSAIWGGYLIPTRDGLLFGATHDRGEVHTEISPADHARNLEQLALGRPALAASIDPEALSGRASIRAVTPDFLPLAGAVEAAEGLFILSGLGSRGFCAAPLLAEHVAALATGAPSPLPRALQAIIDPARFSLRRNRRLGRLSSRSSLDDARETYGEAPR